MRFDRRETLPLVLDPSVGSQNCLGSRWATLVPMGKDVHPLLECPSRHAAIELLLAELFLPNAHRHSLPHGSHRLASQGEGALRRTWCADARHLRRDARSPDA